MDTMMTLKKWQDDSMKFMQRVEKPMVTYTAKVAAPLARYMPERPQRMARLPMVHELVDNQLKFRRRVVDEQAAFVHKMMTAMEPMLMKMDAMPKKRATGAKPQHEELRVPQSKAAHKAA